jgi:hypothetical protein
MTTTQKIIQECEARGVEMTPVAGGRLWIEPEENVTPELLARIRAHKAEILAKFETSRCHGLTHLILDGEFDGCDAATRRKLVNELRSVPHSQARPAVARLESEATR